jgi:cytidylate kinase
VSVQGPGTDTAETSKTPSCGSPDQLIRSIVYVATMRRRVICIARLLGAGSADVGRTVAARLGYTFVDEEIVQRAAETEGISVEELADVERRTSIMDRLLQTLALAGGADGYMVGVSGLSTAAAGVNDPKSLRSLIQKSIHETADRGDVVIVSHAASYALAGRDDVLRVLVTAPSEVRAARAAREGASLDDKAAAKAIATDDAGRAAYLKRFYGVGAELPTHYDLVLNSETLSTDVITGLVVQAAEAG